MFERFTERARQVVVLAQDEARVLKHNYIGTEHILLGLLREEEGVAARVLESLGVTVEDVRAQVVSFVGRGDEVTAGQIPFTPRSKKVLDLALREALSLGHNHIGTEHILLGVARENEGVASRVLLDFDVDAEKIRNEVVRMLARPGSVRKRKTDPGRAVAAFPRMDLATVVMDTKEMLISKGEFEEAARLRSLQRRMNDIVRDIEASLVKIAENHQLPIRRDSEARWEYDVRTIAGSTDTWVEQLMAWRKDGWELLTIVEEGDQRRALLERRVP